LPEKLVRKVDFWGYNQQLKLAEELGRSGINIDKKLIDLKTPLKRLENIK